MCVSKLAPVRKLMAERDMELKEKPSDDRGDDAMEIDQTVPSKASQELPPDGIPFPQRIPYSLRFVLFKL